MFAKRTIIIQTFLLFLHLIVSLVAESFKFILVRIFSIWFDNWHPPTFNLQVQNLSSKGKLLHKCGEITTNDLSFLVLLFQNKISSSAEMVNRTNNFYRWTERTNNTKLRLVSSSVISVHLTDARWLLSKSKVTRFLCSLHWKAWWWWGYYPVVRFHYWSTDIANLDWLNVDRENH